MSECVSKDELTNAINRVSVSVDSKCSSTVFWSTASVAVAICLTLFSFLFTRQNDIAEAVARMGAEFGKAIEQTKEINTSHGVVLDKISESQTELRVFMNVINANLNNLVRSRSDNGMVSPDIAARIAREQIAWAKERDKEQADKK